MLNQVNNFCIIVISMSVHFIACQMRSSDVSEGSCLEPTPPVPNGVNYAWLFSPGTSMFVPIGSQHMYRSYAEYLIGRSPTDTNELDEMELRIAYIGPFVKNLGFGENVGQFCKPFDYRRPNIADMSCRGTIGSSRANTTLISLTHDTLIWTDNASALLFVRCVHGEKDYKVLSPYPRLSKNVTLTIRDKIKQLGFDENYLHFLPYSV